MAEQSPSRSTAMSSTRPGWRTPAALIALSAIPLLAGGIRLAELIGGAQITPQNARFFAAPLPVVLHIAAASTYLVADAFQFVPAIRRRRPGWHRRAGRILVISGLVAALSALWMTQFYPRPAGDGDLLYVFRLVFGSTMVVSIILGFAAIRRQEVAWHRAWMMRGYAIGLGAGTQALLFIVGELVTGPPGEVHRALMMGAGWSLNLVIAEWIIRGRPTSLAGRTATRTPTPLSRTLV